MSSKIETGLNAGFDAHGASRVQFRALDDRMTVAFDGKSVGRITVSQIEEVSPLGAYSTVVKRRHVYEVDMDSPYGADPRYTGRFDSMDRAMDAARAAIIDIEGEGEGSAER